jgi:long-chain acyl-CoA synthetase
MLENNKQFMNYTALTFGDRKITYEELHNGIEKYAKILTKKGIKKGDVIAICTLNTPESVYLIYALDIIGAVTVGLSPFDKKEKIKHDLEITRPKYVVTVDLGYSNVKDFEKALNFSTILYSPLESVDNLKIKYGYKLMQLLKGNFKFGKEHNLMKIINDTNYDGVSLNINSYKNGELTDIMFTGGSTGTHKGVDLSGQGLNHVIEGMKYLYDDDFFEGKTYLGNIPFGHMAYGRCILHIALTNNMEYALTLKAMPNDFYDEMVRTKAFAAVGGPPHWGSLIVKEGDHFKIRDDLKKGSLSNLCLATSGGEKKKKEQNVAINDALAYCGSKTKLGDGLGATEAWSVVTLNSGNYYEDDKIGLPIDTIEYKLVNPETGELAKVGEPGLLYISGDSVMLGYHDNPEETEKVISYDENGKKWCNLGDYLSVDEKGVLTYVGRQKRNHVCGVDNIYPEQLEEKLNAMPEIRETVVTFVPDDEKQYVPIYHISLNDDMLDTSKFEEKMLKSIKTDFSEYWLPYRINYYNEPLKRMMNSKLDIGYYQSIDRENNNYKNETKLIKK